MLPFPAVNKMILFATAVSRQAGSGAPPSPTIPVYSYMNLSQVMQAAKRLHTKPRKFIHSQHSHKRDRTQKV